MHLSSTEINRLHLNLCDELKQDEALACKTVIKPRIELGNWAKAIEGTKVEFVLRASIGAEYADRERGGRCPVVFLLAQREAAPCFWVSWLESWEALGSKCFRLEVASWTFFRGYQSRDQKLQLFRAEWSATTSQSCKNPQPHWNIDQGREHSAGVDQDQTALRELTELNVDYTVACDLSKIHFGMGGWLNGCQHPQCWQCEFDDLDEFVKWSMRTLALAKEELHCLMQ